MDFSICKRCLTSHGLLTYVRIILSPQVQNIELACSRASVGEMSGAAHQSDPDTAGGNTQTGGCITLCDNDEGYNKGTDEQMTLWYFFDMSRLDSLRRAAGLIG